jgi:DNA-binding transcriptional MerR regulator
MLGVTLGSVERDAPTLSIEELASRGGVSRRTVRYYVQRGLLPRPTGVGRGRHYTEAHLERLIEVRRLQEAGVPLAEIASGPSAPAPVPESSIEARAWWRVVLADGVELHVRGRRPSAETVSALKAALAREEDPEP